MYKGTHHIKPIDLQCAHALAQGGFKGVFPALADVQARPQTLHFGHAVLVQPGRKFAVGFDFFLQRLERFKPRGQVGLLVRFGVKVLLGLAALLIKLGGAFLQLLLACLDDFELLGAGGELALHLQQAAVFGGSERVAVGLQALVALGLLAGLLVNAALLGS